MSKNDHLETPLPVVQSSEVMFDEFVKIKRDTLFLPGTKPYFYYSLITKAPAVIILAITEEGQAVVNEEYRHPTGLVLLSLAGGYIDEEDVGPIQSGQRELLEETGYGGGSWSMLGSAYPYAGISEQKIYYVLAKDVVRKADPKREETEVIKTSLMSFDQIKKALASQAPVDGTLCTALCFYQALKDGKG